MDTKSLARVEIKDADKGIVTAVISTFGVVDSDGDVTSKSTFTDGSPVVVSAYGHTSWDGTLPIGKGILTTTDTEAIADLQFFLNTNHGRDAFETIKELSAAGLQEWSYSLEDIVGKRGELNGQPARFIDSTTVKEVSPVLRGASVNTRTLAVKSSDLKFSEHIATVVTAIDELKARAAEVVTLRAEQGKQLSPASKAALLDLVEEVLGLKALLEDEPETPSVADDVLLRVELDEIARSLSGVTS